MRLTLIRDAGEYNRRPIVLSDYLHPSVVKYLYGDNATAIREEVCIKRNKLYLATSKADVPELVFRSAVEPQSNPIRFFSSLREIRSSLFYAEGRPPKVFFCTQRCLDQLSVAPDISNKRFRYKDFDVLFSYLYKGVNEYFLSASQYQVSMNPDTDWYCMYE